MQREKLSRAPSCRAVLPRNAPAWWDRLSTWLEPFEDCFGHVGQRGAFGVTLNFGPLTVSIAPPSIQRGRPVPDVLEQIDRYGLLQRQMATKQQELAGEDARERFQDRLAAFVQPASFTNVILLAAWCISPFGGSDAASSSTPLSACTSSASCSCRA